MAVVFVQPIEQFPVVLAFSNVPVMTSPDSIFPASRLLTQDPTNVARSASTAGTAIMTWDFGSVREFDVVSLVCSNASYQATWVIEGSVNGSAWTSIKASDPFHAHRTTIPGSWTGELNDPRRGSLIRNSSFYLHPTVLTTYRYLRVTVSDTPGPLLTFGRLFVGRSFQPSTGIQYGSSFSFNDSSSRDRTPKGPLITDASPTYISANLKMDFLTKTEMYDFAWDFSYWRGSAREVLCCMDTTDIPRMQRNLIYGTITEGRSISADSFNIYSQSWTLESFI